MKSSTVLIIDDEPSICWAFERMLTQQEHRVLTASSAEEGLRLASQQPIDLIVLDVRLPGQDGIAALPELLRVSGEAPVIVITAFGDLETAVTAVQRGASDYLTKPIKLHDALRACQRALQQRPFRSQQVASDPVGRRPDVLIGGSAAMQQVYRQIALVADSDLTVLISGETGTGKELVAAAIHRHGRRRDRPYLPILPAAFAADAIESALLGHVRGGFGDATDDRAGLFEQAEGGTVLLDEVADVPLPVQVKLLRVLEQGWYTRLGDGEAKPLNVRVIATTHHDLSVSVANGEFREDLHHRLSGMRIHLPPLRDRPEDIAPLCRHFLATMNYPATSAINDDLLDHLCRRPWRGNVRELRNAIQHAAVVARGRPLHPGDLPDPIAPPGESTASGDSPLDQPVARWARTSLQNGGESIVSLHTDFLAATEPALFQEVLKFTGGNRAKAAEILGIHRGTLRDRLRGYGMD